MGMILNIQHFCMNDGPGIRTVVFLSGCPLRCHWCHNPESQYLHPVLFYYPEKCRGCGLCVSRCPLTCQRLTESGHLYDRNRCTACGACVNGACSALEICGHNESTDRVMEQILVDKLFYDTSSGGVTFSGGEPLLQHEFLIELLKHSKEAGLHTCIETCGHIPTDHLLEAAIYTDLFLYDWKLTDPVLHRKYTGVDNTLILSNLLSLDDAGKSLILRCPMIPGINDTPEHLRGIVALSEKLHNLEAIELEPYHSMGKDKYHALGRSYRAQNTPLPDNSDKTRWLEVLSDAVAEVRLL